MGYSIQYTDGMVKEFISDDRPKTKRAKGLLWIVSGAILIGLLATDTGKAFCRNLLPGNPAVTEAALERFAENISDGDGLLDAATVFCKDVLEGAGT